MGGEGVWVGRRLHQARSTSSRISATAPTTTPAIWRSAQAIAAKANITYKILYNDAVAMTGGQPVDGAVACPQIARQVEAEGAKRIVARVRRSRKYPAPGPVPARHHLPSARRARRRAARAARGQGRHGLIYDQTCAAEKRRRRKRGRSRSRASASSSTRRSAKAAAIARCSRTASRSSRWRPSSAASAHQPVDLQQGLLLRQRLLPELRHGRGRQAEEARGAATRRSRGALPDLPPPRCRTPTTPYNILVTGVGGTGVITIGALLGMAAHLEGKGVIGAGHGRPRAKGRRGAEPRPTHGSPTAHLRRNPTGSSRAASARSRSRTPSGPDLLGAFDADKVAVQLLGDSIFTNPLMLGYAWQKGLVPVSASRR
jgi:indolepyruvate ferredoxin oxidoreductase